MSGYFHELGLGFGWGHRQCVQAKNKGGDQLMAPQVAVRSQGHYGLCGVERKHGRAVWTVWVWEEMRGWACGLCGCGQKLVGGQCGLCGVGGVAWVGSVSCMGVGGQWARPASKKEGAADGCVCLVTAYLWVGACVGGESWYEGICGAWSSTRELPCACLKHCALRWLWSK
eukprot:scaffold88607_cov17-Tisochrysis_lutea.AAC.2